MAGRRPTLELLRADKPATRILMAQGLAPSGVLTEIRKRAHSAGIPIRVVPRAEIERIAAGTNHQGVVAISSKYRYTPLREILSVPDPCVLFLDGVTDPHNLGSLVRSAEGAGFGGVVVPARRSVGVTATVRKVAAGAAEVVPVARVDNLSRALEEAQRAGLWIFGFDEDASDDVWSTGEFEPPLGIVLGSEGRGISPTVRKHCDFVLSIPHFGTLESLNVSVAGALAMYEVARRRRLSGTL